jgi:hypothetical protein
MCGAQSRSQRCRQERNLIPLLEIEPRFLGRAARSVVTTAAEVALIKQFTYQVIRLDVQRG